MWIPALAAIGERGLATVLFFSGPVWRPDQDALKAESRWTGSNGRGWELKKDAEGPNPQWLIPNRKIMAALTRMIYQTPTTLGTDWYPPLKKQVECLFFFGLERLGDLQHEFSGPGADFGIVAVHVPDQFL